MSYKPLSALSDLATNKNTNYVSKTPLLTEQAIEKAIDQFGVAPGGQVTMKQEFNAAKEAVSSGIYIIWAPNPSCALTNDAFIGIKDKTSQCCRIGSQSICQCGHKLVSHSEIKLTKGGGFIKPPFCKELRCRCSGYNYCPFRPEECGQWWLPRRKDFNLLEWQKVVKYYI